MCLQDCDQSENDNNGTCTPSGGVGGGWEGSSVGGGGAAVLGGGKVNGAGLKFWESALFSG